MSEKAKHRIIDAIIVILVTALAAVILIYAVKNTKHKKPVIPAVKVTIIHDGYPTYMMDARTNACFAHFSDSAITYVPCSVVKKYLKNHKK